MASWLERWMKAGWALVSTPQPSTRPPYAVWVSQQQQQLLCAVGHLGHMMAGCQRADGSVSASCQQEQVWRQQGTAM